jgi:1-acyl-sn-glycerol-3-phosphate acyltransferase
MKYIWSIWVAIWVIAVFLLLFPLYFLFLQFRTTHRYAHWLNIIWGYAVFFFGLTWVSTIYTSKHKPPKRCIFVANHRSYLDIPALHIGIPRFYRFIAKAELGKVPLFGYMYRKLHITVNRASARDRGKSVMVAEQCLRRGESLVIFPEGTIKKHDKTLMGHFHDGAFILSRQTNIPIVPVTLINTDRAFDSEGGYIARPFVHVKVVIDEPLYPEHYPDLNTYKQKTYECIEANYWTYKTS